MVLTEDNFLIYAMHHYSSPSCVTLQDFEDDLKTITYIKKQLGKKEKNIRLLLNHIIVLFNCFGDAALLMLFFRVNQDQWGALATFLLYINRMPDQIPEFSIRLSDLHLDEQIIGELRKI